MGMANENLCDSCTNRGCIFQSGIVRTECAFYIPPSLTCDNCGNYVVVMQPLGREKITQLVEGENNGIHEN